MPTHSLLYAIAVSTILSIHSTTAQKTFPPTALIDKHFTYPTGIPYKVDTDEGLIRGTQLGYNVCNSTTENQQSLCQTAFFNSIEDFCLWGPPEPNSVIANIEGEMVAWCTKPGRGTRLIPHDALKGVQFTRTPDYIQVVGFIDQSRVNIASDDYGGELDPHGADLRGNPMGGIVFSTAFSSGATYEQVLEWHNFMGGGTFCLKFCDPSLPSAPHLCEHRLDRIGCAYNAPSNAANGTFESCKGDNQDPPGVYTDATGQVRTYTQPPESLGPITTMPYTAKVPKSSECVEYKSEELYKALASATAFGETSTLAATGTVAGGPSAPGNANAVRATSGGASESRAVAENVSLLVGVVFSFIFLS